MVFRVFLLRTKQDFSKLKFSLIFYSYFYIQNRKYEKTGLPHNSSAGDQLLYTKRNQIIGDFIDDWRIRHAAQMLTNTKEPVGIITEMSGVASRSHFNTIFREKSKMTPSEYLNVAKEM